MELRILSSISEIEATQWDSFVSIHDPFARHAFLVALEESKSACDKTGWNPFHIVLQDTTMKSIVGVAPVYLKMHSYGEYIFDWSWAEAAQGAGLPYYPKLVNAIPFTPATGQRFFADEERHRQLLWGAMQQLCAQVQASSSHVLFLREQEYTEIPADAQTIHRLTYQFHWENPNVENFSEWLSLFRAKSKKNTQQERQKAQANVERIYHLWGEELTEKHIDLLWRFYCDTIDRKWGSPYLTRDFFSTLRTTLADQTLVFFAEKHGEIVASSLCFYRGTHLYGRYWGCAEPIDSLHFELCYHRPIELCLKKGWTRFEAGAQGQHKLKRGLLPSYTYSLHHLQHPGLHQAVARAMKQENNYIEKEVAKQKEYTPFKRMP